MAPFGVTIVKTQPADSSIERRLELIDDSRFSITKLEIISWKTMSFGQEWYYPHTMFILEQELMIESDWMCVYACAFFCGHSVRIHHPSSIIHHPWSKLPSLDDDFAEVRGVCRKRQEDFLQKKATSPRT